MAATRTGGSLSTGAYENNRRLLYEDDEDEGEYEPRCCCCDSMNYVRYFGIVATLCSLLALRMQLKEAIEDALLLIDFGNLLWDHLMMHTFALLFCTLSMGFIAVAFKYKIGKLLYGPILMHAIVTVLNAYIGVQIVWFNTMGNPLAKKTFMNRIDDLAFDHPYRKYEELYGYLIQQIIEESRLGGFVTFIQIPLHLTFVVVCWRLRNHLEQQRYLQKARAEREKKKAEPVKS